MTSTATATKDTNYRDKQFCILFYKYHPLTDDPDVLEAYRRATEALCTSLQLTGRILIGLSNDGEGINGTLAGSKNDLDAYVACMLNGDIPKDVDQRRVDAIVAFREASKQFFTNLDLPELFLDSPNDFKWSSWSPSGNDAGIRSSKGKDENWFPDLNIKIVKEIVSTGGAFSNISTKDTSVGYLTPKQWHEEMQRLMEKKGRKENASNNVDGDDTTGTQDDGDHAETILIDVRNHKECQIGSFAPGISIDPQTKTFAQFPQWVKNNSTTASAMGTSSPSSRLSPALLENKRILMYCTGGIRCEKASAYVRRAVPRNKGIYHLKGGIHKYLEEFGQGATGSGNGNGESNNKECAFVGKNFVFDRRGALDAKGHGIGKEACETDPSTVKPAVLGKCQYCSDPYDVFQPENVCTVCREPVLVCEKCKLDLYGKQRSLRGLESSIDDSDDGKSKRTEGRAEFHCEDHFHLKTCYFTSLRGFERVEMQRQIEQLQLHSKQLEGEGKKGKQRRRTLRKQIKKIQARMKDGVGDCAAVEPVTQCRHCGSSTCTSDCWGFHGGNARMVNKSSTDRGGSEDAHKGDGNRLKQRSRVPSNQRPAKRLKRQKDISEIEALQLQRPPSEHRDAVTGMRVPPPVVRILSSGVKGRWVGKTVRWLFNNEFGESLHDSTQEESDEHLDQLIVAGLIRINGSPLQTSASDTVLSNMDTIERIVHWHEPPITVPSAISLYKYVLPDGIIPSKDDSFVPMLFCIDKPSTVPVYPAGPYNANSLLMMVEAQEGLRTRTLVPLHRIDRATSGLLLCTDIPQAARVIQRRMASKVHGDANNPPVRKLYLARVKGKFPNVPSEKLAVPKDYESCASVSWNDDIIEVKAPIAVQLESKTNKSSQNTEYGNDVNTMMKRTVRGDGKKSTSRFKFLFYDSKTNQSLISCCPVTGRGHQLRVHLEFIGYPIHNDIEYGGGMSSKSANERMRASAQAIFDVSAATAQCLHDESVTADEVKLAVQLCRCCSGGLECINRCFNRAQLLGSSHAIDLHAYKYCISFEKKEHEDESVSIEVATGLPAWAEAFADMAPTNNKPGWLN